MLEEISVALRLSLFLPFTQNLVHYQLTSVIILLLLLSSVLSLFIAQLIMPDSYSWIAHTTSESAGQGVEGAWLARLGFITFGLAVIWLSLSLKNIWSRGVF